MSRSGGVEGSGRVYSRERQGMVRARTSGRSRPLSHPRSLPIGILMSHVNETASCSEETNTLASPRFLNVCSVPSSPGCLRAPRSFCLRKASGSGRWGRRRQCSGRQPCGMSSVWFLVFDLLCRQTVSNQITAGMHTSGVQ